VESESNAKLRRETLVRTGSSRFNDDYTKLGWPAWMRQADAVLEDDELVELVARSTAEPIPAESQPVARAGTPVDGGVCAC